MQQQDQRAVLLTAVFRRVTCSRMEYKKFILILANLYGLRMNYGTCYRFMGTTSITNCITVFIYFRINTQTTFDRFMPNLVFNDI
jgi:hypothetical protein